jgi:hypothetical protein
MHLGVWLTSYSLLLAALMLLASAVECLKLVLAYREVLRERPTLGESLADFSLPLALSISPYFICQIAFPTDWSMPVLPVELTFGMMGAFFSTLLVMILRFESAVWFPRSQRGSRARES